MYVQQDMGISSLNAIKNWNSPHDDKYFKYYRDGMLLQVDQCKL